MQRLQPASITLVGLLGERQASGIIGATAPNTRLYRGSQLQRGCEPILYPNKVRIECNVA